MLDIALDCIRRGWYVFPCWPKSKKPMTPNGFKDATIDEAQVRAWWAATPDANVAIATGPSKLCVVDVDHGLSCIDDLDGWLDLHGLKYTYMVRTGRRPEFGVQLYYSGEGLKSTGWRLEDSSGDIRCATGYVVAAGSIHPDSGEAYEALGGYPIKPVPESVRSLTVKANDPSLTTAVDDDTADDWKTWLLEYMDRNKIEPRDYEKRVSNGYWLGIHCPWEDTHGSGAGAESSTVLGILDGKIAFECSHGTCKANKHDTAAFKHLMSVMNLEGEPEPGAEVGITLGAGLPLPVEKEPVDWRTHYHTFEETADAPPVTFIIDNFMTHECVTALASLPGHRKSLLAINIAYAVLSGEPLFGYFKVSHPTGRVIYLCPEMGLSSFAARVKDVGLLPYVGKSFFYRTANMNTLALSELQPEELDGALVIIDTAIRFLKGKENESADLKVFSAEVMGLIGPGRAAAVLLLHHSGKGNNDAGELTLENSLRGSGEMGAFVAQCWATRLQDTNDKYKSASFLTMVKQREFEPEGNFEVESRGKLPNGHHDPRLWMKGEPGLEVTLSNNKFTGNRDGKEETALSIIREHVEESCTKLEQRLAEAGIKRSVNWIGKKRLPMRAKGSTLTEE